MKILILIVLLFTPMFLISCVPKQQTKSYPQIAKTDVSATDVVKLFLESLKTDDFGAAYDQIYVVSSDRQGYISRLNLLREEQKVTLVNYKILATQLFKNTAIVVAELETQHSLEGGIEKKFTRNKYDLKLFDDKWKIIKDSCIENCI
jgi:hypothetical protein